MAVVVIIGLGALGALVGDPGNAPGSTARSTAAPTAAPATPTDSAEAATPEATPEPTPAPEPTAAASPLGWFEPFELSGTGSKVERIELPEGAVGIVEVRHRGDRNFAIWTLAPDGENNKLLVNTIGNYDGTVLFDENTSSAAFQIEADGDWAMAVKHLTAARPWDPTTALEGRGDDVVLVDGPVEGLTVVDIAHSGERNFAIVGYSADGRDLLVNEIGEYSGQSTLPAGILMLEVTADGDWTVTPG